MALSMFMHYINNNSGVRITNAENSFVIVAIAEYCRLVELRDFNKVVCSTEVLYRVAKNYARIINCDCNLAETDCKADFSCEFHPDNLKFGRGKDWFTQPRALVFLSDIHKVNEAQPRELQFDKKYLDEQFNSFFNSLGDCLDLI